MINDVLGLSCRSLPIFVIWNMSSPRMRYFDRGKKATYRGQRDISDIVTFTLKQIENSVSCTVICFTSDEILE